jgi:hypothetical protein
MFLGAGDFLEYDETLIGQFNTLTPAGFSEFRDPSVDFFGCEAHCLGLSLDIIIGYRYPSNFVMLFFRQDS